VSDVWPTAGDVEAVRPAHSRRPISPAIEVLDHPPDRRGSRSTPCASFSNRSSGPWVLPWADRSAAPGARVTLVTGPTAATPPWGAEVVRVRDGPMQMLDACLPRSESSEIIVDERRGRRTGGPRRPARGKTPEAQVELSHRALSRRPTIAAEIGRRKGSRMLVAFAAETGRRRGACAQQARIQRRGHRDRQSRRRRGAQGIRQRDQRRDSRLRARERRAAGPGTKAALASVVWDRHRRSTWQ